MSFNENGILQNGKNQNWKIQNQANSINKLQNQQHSKNIQSHNPAVASSDGGLHQHFLLETKAGISRQPGAGGDVSQSGVTTVRTDFSGLFTGKKRYRCLFISIILTNNGL